MTYKYNPFWQQRIRETVRHALNVHPRLTALRVDLRLPDVPAATDAAVISRLLSGGNDVSTRPLTVFYVSVPLCDNHSAVTATSLLYPNSSPDFN